MTETLPTQDLNIVHAAALVPVSDAGTARRGATQNDLEIIADGALAIRQGKIVAVGTTDEVLADWSDPTITTLDATGKTVLPGLVESHSHPLYGGSRHREYAERLSGATMAEVVARGGGIWTSVQTTRATSNAELLTGVKEALARMTKGGVTTVEVKSGYGLTIEHELHHLELLNSAAQDTPLRTVITFLGAHVVPRDLEVPEGVTPTDYYTDLVAGPML
ncbi:MAG: imidazolonepropionase, partial [Actinobacteria bacterium]|nr:imidazolonepropionase [Actinomycetota bacterium]